MKNSYKKGFTLIELLVVIAVVGVLSGVVLQSLNSARAKARNTQRLENVEAIVKAFQVATTGANNNQFPSSGGIGPVCLGTTGNCWSGYPAAPANVNTLVRSGLAGGVIPLDPFFQAGQQGDAYVYNSNTGTPSVARIFWVMESQGAQQTCGRGVSLPGITPPNYGCALDLGPGTL